MHLQRILALCAALSILTLAACGGGRGSGSFGTIEHDMPPVQEEVSDESMNVGKRFETASGTVEFGAVYDPESVDGFVKTWHTGPAIPDIHLIGSGIRGTDIWEGESRNWLFATWTGDLIGYTDEGSQIDRDVSIGIEVETLQGRAEFTNMTTGNGWNRDELSAWIDVRGNSITTDERDLWVDFDVHFRGASHEAITGSFRYEGYDSGNLTAAFGATRQE